MISKKFGTGKNFIDLTFGQRVVYLAKLIPKGKVTTYGELAKLAGGGGRAAQSITAILSRAEQAGEVSIPFHRIVYAGGLVWLDPQYKEERLKLYEEEKIVLDDKHRIVDFYKKSFDFKTIKSKKRG